MVLEGHVPMCQLHGQKLGKGYESYEAHCDKKHDGAPITLVWVEEEI